MPESYLDSKEWKQYVQKRLRYSRPRKKHVLFMDRLRRDLQVNFTPDAKFQRIYAGRHQRSSGAWLWVIQDWGKGATMRELGSCETVTSLLKAKRIEIASMSGGLEVFGYDKI